MSSVLPHLTCVFLLALWGWSCSSMAFPFNMSMDGSGDEPELIFPTSRSTYVPPPLSASPSPPPSITTTFIRLKDFLFNRVVDFLRDNLLLITVVMSLLVVLIFIVCCASAMSHKRKLEAYYPPKKYVPRKYMAGQGPDRPQQQQQQQGQSQHKPQTTTNYHRTPSKALVGEKEGKDPRPKPQEVQKQVEEVEEVEVPKVVEKKKVDELKPSTSTAGNGQVMVCTCHLKKAH